MTHKWTGNIRELKNLIERAVLIGKGKMIKVEDLGFEHNEVNKIKQEKKTAEFPPIPLGGIDLASIEKAFEKYYIDEAYKMARGNESEAARLLNMNHHTYRYRRKKLLMK